MSTFFKILVPLWVVILSGYRQPDLHQLRGTRSDPENRRANMT